MSSHYYHADGTPCFRVPNASKPGEMRDTTIKDARKMRLLGSVSTIIGDVLAKKALTDWQVNKAIQAAIENGRKGHPTAFDVVERIGGLLNGPDVDVSVVVGELVAIGRELEGGETDEEWTARILEASKGEVREAASFGTKMHAMVEEYVAHTITGAPFVPSDDPVVAASFDLFVPWYEKTVVRPVDSEKVVVGDGYAGTLDLVGLARIDDIPAMTLIDFKTRKGKTVCLKRPEPREEIRYATRETDFIQLAAYMHAKHEANRPTRCASVFINSVEPSEPHMHVWPEDDIERGWRIFRNLRDAWFDLKKYNPTKEQKTK